MGGHFVSVSSLYTAVMLPYYMILVICQLQLYYSSDISYNIIIDFST